MGDRLKVWIDKLVKSTALWYTASSLLAFVIEYIITLAIGNLLLDSMEMGEYLSNYIAMGIGWVISSHVNFFINRRLVFRSDTPALPAYLKYYALALPVFLFKSLGLVTLLLGLTHLPMSVIYPVAQLAMFVITYVVQKRLIFLKTNSKSDFSDPSDNTGDPS